MGEWGFMCVGVACDKPKYATKASIITYSNSPLRRLIFHVDYPDGRSATLFEHITADEVREILWPRKAT